MCVVVAAGGRAVPLSALISIFKWTQFLFESELKVKQLSRRKNGRDTERREENRKECYVRKKNPTPDFILLLLHAITLWPFKRGEN